MNLSFHTSVVTRVAFAFAIAYPLAGCHTSRPDADPARTSPTHRGQLTPLVDAHQHLMSPAATALVAPAPAPPSVTVPAPLATLLEARQGVSDRPGYDTVFTRGAVVYAEEHGRWWTGADRILDAIGNFPSGRRFIPIDYAVDGEAGFISGMLRTADGEDTHTFVLGIRKDAGGSWRISTEMKQPVMPPVYAPAVTADDVISELDDAGIRYATVLSVAYWFGRPGREGDRQAMTRAENDWTIAETAKYPDRLVPFCGVNPLEDYAVAELERCAANPRVTGMKIHRNSRFDLEDPEHLRKMQEFFRAANRRGLAIVVHLRGEVEPWIDHVFPEAPDVPVQIAHMGSSWEDAEKFAAAIQSRKPGTGNLYFDWTQALPIEGLWTHGLPGGGLGGSVSPDEQARIVDIMRRIGLNRILFGSDMPLSWNPSPRDWWRRTILTLPLSDDELRDIADNLPPYIRVSN